MTKPDVRNMVKPEFFNLETYATYTALNELFSKEAWKIVWRAGEHAFAEVKNKLHITETDPILLIKILARYLEDMGYARRLDLEKVGEDEFLWYIYDTASREGLHKIRRRFGPDAVFPHYSTSIMFAALKDMCKMKAEVTRLDPAKDILVGGEFAAPGASIERWKLSKL